MAPCTHRVMQARGLEHQGRLVQRECVCADVTIEMVGSHRIRLTALHLAEGFLQRVRSRHLGTHAVGIEQGLQAGLLQRTGQHHQALALQIERREDVHALALVKLRPAVKGRSGMEIETPGALFGIGDIRHQVDAARRQLVQARRPGAIDELQLPALARRDLAQQLDQDAGRLTTGIGENLGLVLIDADPDFARLHRAGRQQPDQHQQEQQFL